MMKMIRFVLIMLGMMVAVVTQAQDIHFSQFYESTILRNPSLIGLFEGAYKISTLNKSQWQSISKPYQTNLVNAEIRVPINKSAEDVISFGLTFFADKAGTAQLKTQAVYPCINYSKSLGGFHNEYISLGFTIGYLQRNFDISKLTFNEQYFNSAFNASNANGENITNTNSSQLDVGVGLNYSRSFGYENGSSFYLGAAAYHLNQPKSNFTASELTVPMRFNVNMGWASAIGEFWNMQLLTNACVQGAYLESTSGLLFNYRTVDRDYKTEFILQLGTLYRFQDAIIPTVKCVYRSYQLGLSYDINVSSLKSASSMRGGLECSLALLGVFRNANRSASKTICPHFY
jgi:type IX secretion system PorP/SprF family membrane protein